MPGLLSELSPPIARVTLDRPDKRNALSSAEWLGLRDLAARIAADPALRVTLLQGAGDAAFSAGADIAEIAAAAATPAGLAAVSAHGTAVFTRIERFAKPVIAAVNGFALGGGCELALACHLRVASTHAKFGLPEVKLGLIPGYGGTQRLPRLIGQGRALQLILTGEAIDAETAHRIGLANDVVAGDMLLEAARSLAKMMVAQGPLALAHAITAVTAGADLPLDAALALEATHFDAVGRTEDMREGTAAFLAKRAPAFRGA